ncbi:MAG: S-layer homology domain-containing protein [Cyanobacteria bacterium J06621_11]
MTQSPTPPPNDPRRDDERSRTTGPLRPLELDEMVALFVAFLSLGGVLFWGLTRSNMNLFSDSPLASGPVLTGPLASGENAVSATGSTEPEISTRANESNATAADIISGDEESAVSQLSDRAAARRERLAARKPVWEDVRDGMVGAAAGVAGVTATTDGATAAIGNTTDTPEAIPQPSEAASEATSEAETAPSAAEPSAAVSENEVPDIGQAIPKPSEAASKPPEEAILFDDVPQDYWAAPYIDALSSRGLISGYEDGTFKPDQPVTRAQIANIVSRTFDLTSDKENLEFTDVTEDNWARESIGEVVKGGFMTGFPNDTFEPNQPVTRAQSFTTLVTGLGIETPTNIQATLDRYEDANAIPQWANEKVAAATAGSLVINYPSVAQLNPTQPTTRAELSAMIYQALVREGIVESVDSEYVVQP